MSISISQLKDHSISVDQDRYFIDAVWKYLDNATRKEISKYHKNTFPQYMVFTKEDAYTSDE